MKKLLGIVVLGLLWCNVGFAVSIHDLVYPGINKKELQKLTDPAWFSTVPYYSVDEITKLGGWGWPYGEPNPGYGLGEAFCPRAAFGHDTIGSSNQHQYFPKYKTEIFTHNHWQNNKHEQNNFPWYVFENVTNPIKCKPPGREGHAKPYKGSDGILKAIAWSKEEALMLADPTYAKRMEEKRLAEEKILAEEKRLAEQRRLAEEKKKKEEEKKLAQKQLSEDLNQLVAEIEENGVVPFERDMVFDDEEFKKLIIEQHKFVEKEKALILNDLNGAKKLCKDMGFSETTLLIFKSEKFSQCVLTIWQTELMGKKYAKMQKELDTQLAEIKQKQIELNDVASALNRTRNQQITRITEVQQSSGLESLIKGALGIAAGYYLGKAIGGSTGTGGQTSQGHTTILRGYRCTMHPTAFDC